MNVILIFLILVFGQVMLAQKLNNFYFEFTANSTISTKRKENLSPALNTPYFKIEEQKTIMPDGLSPLLLGFNFGYEFNNKNKLQIGIAQDEIVQGISVVGLGTVSSTRPNIYGTNEFGSYGGVTATNISLLYKFNILNSTSSSLKKDVFLKLHLNFGISYFYKPNNGFESLSGSGWSYTSIDSNYVEIAYRPRNIPVGFKNSFKFNLGFDLTIGKKNKEWFNLNFAFITNHTDGAYFISSNTTIDVIDKYSNKTTYFFSTEGTGNGIYFGVSRRFYPFKWSCERQQRKLDEYKNKQ